MRSLESVCVSAIQLIAGDDTAEGLAQGIWCVYVHERVSVGFREDCVRSVYAFVCMNDYCLSFPRENKV